MTSKASMNHAFRLVWSDENGCYVPVPETAKGRGKRTSRMLLASVLLGLAGASSAQVLPGGAQIGAGQAQIGTQGSQMTVHQGSDKLILNWNSFNIGTGGSVHFEQPHASSVVLNRVLGGGASQIDGQLTANGQVWLINPQGVAFGKGAQVQVGALVASTLGVRDEDFLAGRAHFDGQGSAGALRNEGHIQADVVALLAPRIDNSGQVLATQAALVAADKVALDFGGDGLLQVQVEKAALDAQLSHSGRIEGQQVLLSAQGASALRASVLNMDGIVEAKGLSEQGGRIMLDGGEHGTVQLSGTLDASSAQGQGGRIEVQGGEIQLRGATLDASGATGGGLIHVGGGWQGQDATLRNAAGLTADAATVARADARDNGQGGEVVFWSDGRTEFAGNISVRGGATGGDGGRAEVSGKQELAYRGRTDARADHGRTGDLMLDPSTITVRGGAGSGSISGSDVYEQDLEAQTANVLLNASGNITFADLNLNGGDGKITMQNNVSLRVETGGGDGIISFANNQNTIEVFGTGSIMMVAGGTDSGSITNVPILIAHGTGSNVGTLPTHNVSSVGSGTPGAASITLFGADGITVGGSLTTHGGYVRIWADSDAATGGSFTLNAPVNTNGGNLYIAAGTAGITLNSSMNVGSGRLFLDNENAAYGGSGPNGPKTLAGQIIATGDIDINTAFTFKGGAGVTTDGTIRFGNVNVNLDTGTGVLTLRADRIDWGTATLSNLSTASLRLEPYVASTSMVLGDASGFASATTLAKLPGIKNLTIGRQDGTGTISVSSNFSFDASNSFELVNRTLDITAGTLTNTTGGLTLTGDYLDISQLITAKNGTGKVTLRQMTAANDLHLGSGLNSASVGQVRAATLEIGRSDGGNLVFDSDIATTATSVHLKSGQRVVGVNGGVAASNLAITAGAGAEISDDTFNFTTLALKTGGTTSITSQQANWGLGTVDGLSGLSIDAASTVTLKSTGNGVLDLKAPINFNGNAATLRLEAGEFVAANPLNAADKATVSGQSQATVEFAMPGAGQAFTVGGTGSQLTEASLQAFNGINVMHIDAQDDDVTLGALQVSARDRLEVNAGTLTQTAAQRVNTGSLHLSAEQGGLLLDNALNAAGTVSLNDKAGSGIGGSGAITAGKLALRSTGSAALAATTHQLGEIAASVGSLQLSNAGSLVVGSADGLNGISATDRVDLRALGATSDLQLNQAVSAANSSAAATPLLLQAGRNFINTAGSAALQTTSGRWLVYSSSPSADTRGGLSSAFKQYDATPASTVLGSGNGFLYTVAPSLTVSLSGNVSKVYDGLTTATLNAGNFSTTGAIDGDTVRIRVDGQAHYDDKNVNTGKLVSVDDLVFESASNAGVQVYGYRLTNTTASAAIGTITPRTIELGAGSVSDKVYDGSNTAQIGAAALSGLVAGDAVLVNGGGSAFFSDKNVGTNKAVTVYGITLGGADAGNYTLSTTTTASITPRQVELRADVASKVYDGSTAAQFSQLEVAGLVAGDQISVSNASVQFADKNAGDNKLLVLAGQLAGADAGNYALSDTTMRSGASITQREVTAEQLAVAAKVYDGLRDAAVSAQLAGTVAGDQIALQTQGQFDTKNAGVNKDVAVSLLLTGADAGNYKLATSAVQAKGDITAKTVTAEQLAVAAKVYDGLRDAAVSAQLTGTVAGDQIALQAQGQFDTKNVGVNKDVAVSLQLTGADAGNYTLATSAAQAKADITVKTLNLGPVVVKDKVYDGKLDAELLLPELTGVVAGDQLGLQGQGQFDSATVSLDKTVQITLGLVGQDAGNYRLSQPTQQVRASITSLPASDATTALLARPAGGNGDLQLRWSAGSAFGDGGSLGAGLGGGLGGGLTAASGGLAGGLVDLSGAGLGSGLGLGLGAGPSGGVNGAANPGGGAVTFSMEQVLSHQGQVSLATGGDPLPEPRQSMLPVYRDEGGSVQPRGLAQLRVDDLGDSMAVSPVDTAAPQRDAVQGAVRQRAEALLELAHGERVWLRMELLDDGTLRTQAPRAAEALGEAALSAFSLSTLKQQTGVAPGQVRAVLLNFEG